MQPAPPSDSPQPVPSVVAVDGRGRSAEAQRIETAQRAAEHLRRIDPRMAALIDHIGPHRLIITRDPFKTLVGSILSQQVSMSAAAAMQMRLRKLCPRGRVTPAAILALDDAAMRRAGLSRQKMRYLRDLAEHFADGRLRPAALRRLGDEQVIEAATQVLGIGRWTAEMLLMFCLERPDVWPIDDLGLRKAVRNYLGMKSMPSPRTMRRAGEPFRPYRSYASWYLWRSLEGPFMPGLKM